MEPEKDPCKIPPKKIKLVEPEETTSSRTYEKDSEISFTVIEKEFMEKAFNLANEALEAQEVPVGCIFVYGNEIIAVGRNTVNETRNATRHAEMNCIDEVDKYCKINNLNVYQVFQEITVYVTVEPCIMCAAALYDLKIKCVVFGCKNDRFGGETVFNVANVLNPVTQRKGGYRAVDAMNLLKLFYQGVNPCAPPSKVKVRGKKIPSNPQI